MRHQAIALVCLLAGSPALADTATPAAGVLASLKPPVRVERAGGKVPIELGMRLMNGDVVTVGTGGTALLYVAGGAIVRVPEGGRFELSAKVDPQKPEAKFSAGAMKASESGLWVLNDPDGSILVAGMRGDGDTAWADGGELRAEPLSPRYETLLSRTPSFVARGGARPVKVAVAQGKTPVWRSGALQGNGPWEASGIPDLDAAKVYSWRLEGADGAPLSEWVPFRVPTAADADSVAAFEKEMGSLAESADGQSAADVLRCGRYLETSSWTPLLAASTRLLKAQPESTVAKRARESALRGLRLDAERAAAP